MAVPVSWPQVRMKVGREQLFCCYFKSFRWESLVENNIWLSKESCLPSRPAPHMSLLRRLVPVLLLHCIDGESYPCLPRSPQEHMFCPPPLPIPFWPFFTGAILSLQVSKGPFLPVHGQSSPASWYSPKYYLITWENIILTSESPSLPLSSDGTLWPSDLSLAVNHIVHIRPVFLS